MKAFLALAANLFSLAACVLAAAVGSEFTPVVVDDAAATPARKK